jgi:PAS domain-containing protein
LSWSANILQSEGIVFAEVRDVTRQKFSEEVLIGSEKKYRTLFESDPDYTLLFNRDGIIGCEQCNNSGDEYSKEPFDAEKA